MRYQIAVLFTVFTAVTANFLGDFDLSNIGGSATTESGQVTSTVAHGNITPPTESPQPLIQVKINFSKLMELLINKSLSPDGTITLDVPDTAISVDNSHSSQGAAAISVQQREETATMETTTATTPISLQV